jgi:hypothetical protein
MPKRVDREGEAALDEKSIRRSLSRAKQRMK